MKVNNPRVNFEIVNSLYLESYKKLSTKDWMNLGKELRSKIKIPAYLGLLTYCKNCNLIQLNEYYKIIKKFNENK